MEADRATTHALHPERSQWDDAAQFRASAHSNDTARIQSFPLRSGKLTWARSGTGAPETESNGPGPAIAGNA
jgi:hypothetical protein